MIKLKDMKIGLRLTLSFSAILIMMTALGILSYRSLRTVQTANWEIESIEASVIALGEARHAGQRLVDREESVHMEAVLKHLSEADDAIRQLLEINSESSFSTRR